ncbi:MULTISPECIES: hypothetical protein [Salinicola]|uniref:hypothetical protein n=1 Tax=Salinicola TaxID=404432 RepID=UPI0011821CAB|nr:MULTISPECIES: hypothetical protein [Salinicola]
MLVQVLPENARNVECVFMKQNVVKPCFHSQNCLQKATPVILEASVNVSCRRFPVTVIRGMGFGYRRKKGQEAGGAEKMSDKPLKNRG